MSDPVDQTDKVLTIPVSAETPSIPERNTKMAEPIDLPPNVASQLMAESVTNGQSSSQNARNVSNIAMGVLQAAAARNFDELGTVESRANSAVLATPAASPTTQAGG